ncbi:MAG: F0F1 ATP synthase subunit alpha, partial [Fulvivirga sp.]|nr:F0F1 ATP synthase subunit alpha [Fulvivirga sp.]
GTLKLDQAQFRELEAFAKFGSDLDAATKLTIERGKRNLEILKQPQYSPVPVEEQVAIIYVSTKGMIDDVPIDKVKEFEQNLLDLLRSKHAHVLETLAAGKLEESATDELAKVAKDLAKEYA